MTSKIINFTQRLQKKAEAENLASAKEETYGHALDILDELLNMKEGDSFLVFFLDGLLQFKNLTNTGRFQIDLEDLQ